MTRTMADIRARLAQPTDPQPLEYGTVTNLKQFHVKPDDLIYAVHEGACRPYPAAWSSDDLLMLYQLRVEQGWATQDIADKLGRTDLAVRLKLARKGWTEPHKRRA